ncbi:MAG: DUF1127 domain-containing protein [Alphaproteobacteria bacterium]|nr:DUF1127 domain-containing protein [Alphaproteobacteria bacterium]
MVTFLPSLSRRLAGLVLARPSSPGVAGTGPSLLARAVIAVLRWQDRARQRHHLATLDDRMLRDLGITRDDVARTLQHSVWRR